MSRACANVLRTCCELRHCFTFQLDLAQKSFTLIYFHRVQPVGMSDFLCQCIQKISVFRFWRSNLFPILQGLCCRPRLVLEIREDNMGINRSFHLWFHEAVDWLKLVYYWCARKNGFRCEERDKILHRFACKMSVRDGLIGVPGIT